jgi:diphthine-ammonia ligase
MPVVSFCSWSGGKDSALALYKAMADGHQPRALLTMMAEDRPRSRSHGLSETLLRRQSARMEIRHVFAGTSWADYEAVFRATVASLKAEGIECGVFGDIDLAAYLEWVARVCANIGITYREPLWGMDRRRVLEELHAAGFRAIIVSCDKARMGERFLGREIDPELIEELESIGVDAAGEQGEYHTFVLDGPLFREPVGYRTAGIEEHGRYVFLTLE